MFFFRVDWIKKQNHFTSWDTITSPLYAKDLEFWIFKPLIFLLLVKWICCFLNKHNKHWSSITYASTCLLSSTFPPAFLDYVSHFYLWHTIICVHELSPMIASMLSSKFHMAPKCLSLNYFSQPIWSSFLFCSFNVGT